ncbi:hypothetical protein [Delftia acidovorans]|uniref:hypothetical protein n=1 Tax=Delftia acidovorans TaxID=80866 RepID=UPI001E3C4C8D|nr:hypothetical protein [Delftia acidovorans]
MAGGVAILEAIKSKAWQAGVLVLVVLLALQTWRLHAEQLAHQRLITAQAQQVAGQAVEGLTLERKLATAESTHATKTQEASDAFTQARPARDAAMRADLDRVERLRLAAERSAATARAQAQANAAAGRDLADRYGALAQHVASGAAVVAVLRADLARRDDEVVLLRSQIDVDRQLISP